MLSHLIPPLLYGLNSLRSSLIVCEPKVLYFKRYESKIFNSTEKSVYSPDYYVER